MPYENALRADLLSSLQKISEIQQDGGRSSWIELTTGQKEIAREALKDYEVKAGILEVLANEKPRPAADVVKSLSRTFEVEDIKQAMIDLAGRNVIGLHNTPQYDGADPGLIPRDEAGKAYTGVVIEDGKLYGLAETEKLAEALEKIGGIGNADQNGRLLSWRDRVELAQEIASDALEEADAYEHRQALHAFSEAQSMNISARQERSQTEEQDLGQPEIGFGF